MGSILWLASYPKSGNTWLRAFLANLVANRRDPVPLAELPRYCEDEALPELYARRAGRPSTELDMEQIAALRPLVHADIAARHPGIVFVK
ncbi:MAG TPA: sulfotransferase domain-containing protein, partial [Rudaea sp.]|nr:sulfotransferase domain-containing protein [Rudaea sp.]